MRRVRCSTPRMARRSRGSWRARPVPRRCRPDPTAGARRAGPGRRICRGNPTWTVFTMQCLKKFLSVLALAALAACAGNDAAQLRIRSADVTPGVLTARLEWQPSEAVLDALDHGIVLQFVFDLRAYAPG